MILEELAVLNMMVFNTGIYNYMILYNDIIDIWIDLCKDLP